MVSFLMNLSIKGLPKVFERIKAHQEPNVNPIVERIIPDRAP